MCILFLAYCPELLGGTGCDLRALDALSEATYPSPSSQDSPHCKLHIYPSCFSSQTLVNLIEISLFQVNAIRGAGFRASSSDLELGNANGDYVPFRNEASPQRSPSPVELSHDEHSESEPVSNFEIVDIGRNCFTAGYWLASLPIGLSRPPLLKLRSSFLPTLFLLRLTCADDANRDYAVIK